MYILLPTKISVVFYNKSEDRRAKLISLLTHTKIHHCSIILERDDEIIELASDKRHRAKFVDRAVMEKLYSKPIAMIDMGERNVSIKQLTDFLKDPYVGDARSLLFWYFIGRYLFPRLLPPSCALITCYLLRLCGFKVNDHIEPKTLYKEILQCS